MSERNMSLWGSLISAYAKQGQSQEAIILFQEMQEAGILPDKVVTVAVLKACSNLASLEQGKRVHTYIMKSGFESDVFVGSTLVHMYAKCGCLEDALQVFRNMPQRNVVSWTAMISGLAQQGRAEEALILFKQMQQEGVKPNNVTFVSILKACSSVADLKQGRTIHSLVIESDLEMCVFVGNSLIDMYAKCGSIEDASRVFNKMRRKNVISWTAMITGSAQQGHREQALALFQEMQQEGVKPDTVTFAAILKACASLADLDRGKQIHNDILASGFVSDVFVASTLVDMYVKCGSLEDARQVFNAMHKRNTISWNTLIAGYAKQGYDMEAWQLFQQMQMEGVSPDVATWNSMIGGCTQKGGCERAFFMLKQMEQSGLKPNIITFVNLLKTCATPETLEKGKEVHAHVIKNGFESDVCVGNSLIDMYAKCGSIEDALDVFKKMKRRDLISWNAMIAGYVQQGLGEEALSLFGQMQEDCLKPDDVTFVNILKACTSLANLEQGKQFHESIIACGFESDVFVGSTLIDMYMTCGRTQEARRVFNNMHEHNVVSWTAMIAGFFQNGEFEEALRLFRQMQQHGIQPDKVLFISILKSCTSQTALKWGQEIHAYVTSCGFESDAEVGNALVVFYGKCGRTEDALQAFHKICNRDTMSWNSIIATYAHEGLGKEALNVFEEMIREGVKLDEITFVCVLSACSHSGLVSAGYYLFTSMSQDYDITPAIEHYVCIVDLLGRAGCLDEMEEFIKKMPIHPDARLWMAVLASCRSHGDAKLGRLAFDPVCKLDPSFPGAYVLLSNVYAAAGMWDEVTKIRKEMEDAGVDAPESAELRLMTTCIDML